MRGNSTELIQIPAGIEKAAEFIEFCKWSAQPKSVRLPSEQKELAQKLGVNETHMSEWKNHPEFGQNRRYFIQQWIGDDLPEVMEVVKKYALRGNLGHIQTMLKWLGELVDTPQVNVDNRTVNFRWIGEGLESSDGSSDPLQASTPPT